MTALTGTVEMACSAALVVVAVVARWALAGAPRRRRPRQGPGAGRASPPGVPWKLPVGCGAAVAAAVVVSAPAGVAAPAPAAGCGVLAACGAWLLLRGTGRAGSVRASRGPAAEIHQLPLTADLLASCLAAGAVPERAAEAVADSVGPPMSGLLGTVAAELRLGADPAACWSRLADRRGLEPLGRCLERASATGTAPAEAVAALAAEQRSAASRAALAAARRAGVLATAPLGLCFLPAFLLVGVAPVVIGLATELLAR